MDLNYKGITNPGFSNNLKKRLWKNGYNQYYAKITDSALLRPIITSKGYNGTFNTMVDDIDRVLRKT